MARTVRNKLPLPKYKVGTLFKHIDTEITYILQEVRLDTYILCVLTDSSGKQIGESLITLEYDYEEVKI
jgi:hypothetical protein